MFATTTHFMNFTPKLLILHLGTYVFSYQTVPSYDRADISFYSCLIKHYNTVDTCIEEYNSIL
jgi:hypothetical protein